jgi:hypothetical protein
MKYAVEMDSVVIIYIPSFIKSGSVIQKLMGRKSQTPQTHRKHGDLISLLLKGKAITGNGGPHDCETSKLIYFLDNRLTDGGEVVILTRRPPLTTQEDSWYSLLLEDGRPQGHILGERIRLIEKSSSGMEPATFRRVA